MIPITNSFGLDMDFIFMWFPVARSDTKANQNREDDRLAHGLLLIRLCG